MNDAAARAAGLLLDVRRTGQALPQLPTDVRPSTASDAYDIQDATMDGLAEFGGGGHVAGYKVGCTNDAAQAELGVDSPFFGRLLSPFLRQSPAAIPADALLMRRLEPEIAFRVAQDLPPGGAPYDPEAVRDAMAAVMPAIEIVDSRYLDWSTVGFFHLAADNGCAGYWVHGAETINLDAIDFTDHASAISVNGEVKERGNASNVLGNPLNSLTWLANALAERGLGLEAGQLVTTGTTTPTVPAERRDVALADFGILGTVEVTFT